MPGWAERRTSFGAVAADYAALRPGYPADAVAFLLGDRPLRVLDLGAGTGLLTDVLLAAGHDVVAVDLSEPMLDQLRARLPQVTTALGGAEHVPLPDGDVDAVVAGTAAHWFDPPAAAAEFRRVLRPGGVVGLCWNLRDDQVPWVRAIDGLLPEGGRGHEDPPAVVARFAAELPADVQEFRSGVRQQLTPEQVVGRMGTSSYVVTLDDAARADLLGRVRELLATHPDTRGRDVLELPYRTVAYRLTPR